MDKFPHESFVYLGDTARLPYGSKSPKTIERYLLQNIEFLIKANVKAIIVACNSASTALLDHDHGFELPVYNVIEPGAKAAIAASSTKRIGVIGTNATIHANSYAERLMRIDQEVVVFQQACPLLVPLVEEGWEDDPLTNLIIYRYLHHLLEKEIDTLILGCTHYPALRGGIGRVVGSNMHLIDSSDAIATLLLEDFAAGRIGTRKINPLELRSLKLLTTDVSQGFSDVAMRLMRPHKIPALQAVDLA